MEERDNRFTPGPWFIDHHFKESGNTKTYIKNKDGNIIASMYYHFSDDEAEPDAALIASAPELYEALENLLKSATRLYETDKRTPEFLGQISKDLTEAESALSKVRGKA